MMKRNTFLLTCLLIFFIAYSQNPIIPADEGITDSNIRIYDGVAYMTACHGHSPDNEWFHIDHWVMYSSADLVNWKLEYALQPEETYIGKPYEQCWAADFVKKDGRFYWSSFISYIHYMENGCDLYKFNLSPQTTSADLCFVFRGAGDDLMVLDSFSFN